MADPQKGIYDFILNHFGLICFVLGIFLTGVQKLHSFFQIKKKPELKEGYQKAVLGFLIIMDLPWLIIAVGEAIYSSSGILLLFSLKDGNPFSWLFYITLFCEYIFLIIWIWFKGGGEFLHKYQLMNYEFSSPTNARLLVTLMVLGGTAGLVIFCY